MEKELKKSYYFMELPYSATIEEVTLKQDILIKIYNSKANAENKNYDKEIEKVNQSAKLIIENINKNGIPNEKEPHFNTSWQSILILCVVALFVGLICFASFYILL